MPRNNGLFRRRTRMEGALSRLLTNIEAYQGKEEMLPKLNKAEEEVASLKHNIQLPKRGRSYG